MAIVLSLRLWLNMHRNETCSIIMHIKTNLGHGTETKNHAMRECSASCRFWATYPGFGSKRLKTSGWIPLFWLVRCRSGSLLELGFNKKILLRAAWYIYNIRNIHQISSAVVSFRASHIISEALEAEEVTVSLLFYDTCSPGTQHVRDFTWHRSQHVK